MKQLKHIYYWLSIKFSVIMIRLSIALRNTELEILRSVSDEMLEAQKRIQRHRHRNQTLERFYAGKRDEKYVQQYYEILRKADKFIKTATPWKMAVTADKHNSTYGRKDKYGRQHEHFGYFDPKHKHRDRTLEEVIREESISRRTTDDNYELLFIYDNKPIEVGLGKIFDVVDTTDKEGNFKLKKQTDFAKRFDFPISITRVNKNCVNKIEYITDYLHVKKIGFDVRQLEFFVNLKYGTINFGDDSGVFQDLTNMDIVLIRDRYGEYTSYKVEKFLKRLTVNETHDVFKFQATEIEKIN